MHRSTPWSRPAPTTSAAASRCAARCRPRPAAASAPSSSSTTSARCRPGPDDNHDVRPHPHIGLATVTYLFEGAMLHRDSTGVVQRIEPGAINWMSAGRGIVHSERTPDDLRGRDAPQPRPATVGGAAGRPTRRARRRFAHTAGGGACPALEVGGARLRLLVGEAFGERSPVRPASPTLFIDVRCRPATPSRCRRPTERALYGVDGALHARRRAGAGADPGRARGRAKNRWCRPRPTCAWPWSAANRSARASSGGTSSPAAKAPHRRRRPTTGPPGASPPCLARPSSSRCPSGADERASISTLPASTSRRRRPASRPLGPVALERGRHRQRHHRRHDADRRRLARPEALLQRQEGTEGQHRAGQRQVGQRQPPRHGRPARRRAAAAGKGDQRRRCRRPRPGPSPGPARTAGHGRRCGWPPARRPSTAPPRRRVKARPRSAVGAAATVASSGAKISATPATPSAPPAMKRRLSGVRHSAPGAQAGEQRRGRITHRHQARGHMALGVVDAQVGQAVHEHALQRQRRLLRARPKVQPLAAPGGQRQHRRRGEREACRHAVLRRHAGQLVDDGVPGRAPDQHRHGEQLPGRQTGHRAAPCRIRRRSVACTRCPGRAAAGRCPRARSRSCRRSRRRHARIGAEAGQRAAGFGPGSAAGRVDVRDLAARAGLDQPQPHRAVVGRRSASSSRWSSSKGCRPVEHQVRRGSARMATGAGRRPARRRFSSASDAGEVTSSAKPSANAVSASVSPVQRRSDRRRSSGSKRTSARRAAEEVAEPLRRQRAHVVGLDDVVPDAHPGRRLRPRPAPGAAPACRARAAPCRQPRSVGCDQRQARQFALGQHLALRRRPPSRRGRARDRSRPAAPRAARARRRT